LDNGDEMIERIAAPSLGVERDREIEARLVVERIGGDFLLQVGERADRLCLLGEIEGRARGYDRGVVRLRAPHWGELLPRLVERAGLDMGARQTRQRLHVTVVLGEELRV